MTVGTRIKYAFLSRKLITWYYVCDAWSLNMSLNRVLRSYTDAVIRIQSDIILSIIYYAVVVPMAFVRRLAAAPSKIGWHEWRYTADSLDDLKKQF